MAVSGSTNYTQTRNEIIADTLNLLGVYGIGDTVSSAHYTFCSNILNKMVKGWEMKGIHMWTEEEGVIFLTSDKNEYILTTSGGATSGANIITTQLTSDATASTTIVVASTDGMTIGDKIAVKMDSSSYLVTTIANISTTTITLTDALTTTAADGSPVFSYTALLDRPLHITRATFLNAGGSERPIELVGREAFMNMPNKLSTGKATIGYYTVGVSSAKLHLWPTPDSDQDCVRISYLRRINDFDSSSDNADLPQEWLEAITYNLAVRVAPAFGIDTNKRDPSINLIAAMSLRDAELWDAEESSVNIVPRIRYDE